MLLSKTPATSVVNRMGGDIHGVRKRLVANVERVELVVK